MTFPDGLAHAENRPETGQAGIPHPEPSRGAAEYGKPGADATGVQMDCLPAPTRRPSAREIAETFHKTPALVAYRVRCGKANCRCRQGELHGPYWFLRWREGGRQRRRYVKVDELAAVRAVIERRHAEERADRLARVRALAMLRGWNRWLTELEHDPYP